MVLSGASLPRSNEDRIPKGLSEDVIRLISAKKKEPEFMLEWRLKAYRTGRAPARRTRSRSGRM
jgi:hypothetical protein